MRVIIKILFKLNVLRTFYTHKEDSIETTHYVSILGYEMVVSKGSIIAYV